VAALIEKGTQARLRRDWATVAKVCRRVRQWDGRSPIHAVLRVQLEILEASSQLFEEDAGARLIRLQRLGNHLTPAERTENFLLMYELSGCLIHSRSYGSALQFSQQAEVVSSDYNSWLSAHLNTLVCREAMGLEVGGDLTKVERRLAGMGNKVHQLNPKSLNEVALLRLRHHFRHGRVDLLESRPAYGLLYYWWLRSLPQLKWKFKTPKIKGHSVQSENSYSRFTMNTILFRRENDDLVDPPMNHWCDRFYLWAWTRHLKPEQIPLSHLWWLLEGFEFERWVERMTMEDRIMVYHSLILLTVGEPKAQSLLRLLLARLGPLDYLSFPYLAQELKRLESIRKKLGAQGPSARRKISVAVGHGRIDGPRREWSIFSGSMSRALALLLNEQSTGSVSLDRFVQEVFDLPVFDSLIHYRKVYNLLERLKRMRGSEVSFRIRSPNLHFQIASQRYRVVDESSVSGWDAGRWQRLSKRIERNLSMGMGTSSILSDVPMKTLFLLKPWCTRAEIERSKGWNKSTATRRIRAMLAVGTLTKQGQGRSVRYAWVSQR
jgi:hypothetical protein